MPYIDGKRKSPPDHTARSEAPRRSDRPEETTPPKEVSDEKEKSAKILPKRLSRGLE